jgi:hypothetical protein
MLDIKTLKDDELGTRYEDTYQRLDAVKNVIVEHIDHIL